MAVALGLLVLRLGVGLIVAAHGAQKLFGWWGGPGMKGWTGAMTRMRLRPAVAWAWISALGELVGGLAVAAGLLSPFGSLALLGSMIVAIALVHWPRGFWSSKGGYEFNLLIVAAAVSLAFQGPGDYSLDGILRIHLPEPATLTVGAIALAASLAVAFGTRSHAPAEQRSPQAT